MRRFILCIFIFTGFILSPDISHCCSVFSYYSNERSYFGSSEAWFLSPKTQITFCRNTAGYSYAGFGYLNDEYIQGGVNEKGLAFDWVASGERVNWKKSAARAEYAGQLSVRMLQRCATVDEAVALFRAFNEPGFTIAKIMVSDAGGNSAIIGWLDNDIHVVRSRRSCQALGYMEEFIARRLAENPEAATDYFSELFSLTAQRGFALRTCYSYFIDLRERRFFVRDTLGGEKIVFFNLDEQIAKGSHTVVMSDIFAEGQ